MRTIKKEHIGKFRAYLIAEEKTGATVEKYTRDIEAFMRRLSDAEVTKSAVLAYKHELSEEYAPASVNSALSSLNSFFTFMEWHDLRVRALKIQRRVFASGERELSKSEYARLLAAARMKSNQRLYYLLQAICSTGIRVSEVKFITVEAVKREQARITCKGKIREILLPKQLCKMLMRYAREQKIESGAVFISKNGKPLDRSNIWSDMKKLCEAAGVPREKVFPHNLRHLFARTFYSVEKDLARLADILGHSSVNTTRIYTMESGQTHRRKIQKLGLLQC